MIDSLIGLLKVNLQYLYTFVNRITSMMSYIHTCYIVHRIHYTSW